jgi:hypothetical protein
MNNKTYFEIMSKLTEVKDLWKSVITKLENDNQDLENKAA